jgi:hypothetical protein
MRSLTSILAIAIAAAAAWLTALWLFFPKVFHAFVGGF